MYAGFSGSSDKRSDKYGDINYKMPTSKAMITNLYAKEKAEEHTPLLFRAIVSEVISSSLEQLSFSPQLLFSSEQLSLLQPRQHLLSWRNELVARRLYCNQPIFITDY
jgi:hypothetical protein